MPSGGGALLSTVTRFLHVAVHRDGPPLNALPHLALREGTQGPAQGTGGPKSSVGSGGGAGRAVEPFAGVAGVANAEVPVVAADAVCVPCIAGISRNGGLLCSAGGAEVGLEVSDGSGGCVPLLSLCSRCCVGILPVSPYGGTM